MKSFNQLFILLLVPVLLTANTRLITKVHSGDLVEFQGGFTVHLLGVKAPDKTTALGYKAYDFTKRSLEGKIVKLFTYTTNNMASGIVRAKDGHAYAQIVCGKGMISKDWDTNFNELLLEKGYARIDTTLFPKEVEHFTKIEKKAREQQIGIWGKLEKQ